MKRHTLAFSTARISYMTRLRKELALLKGPWLDMLHNTGADTGFEKGGGPNGGGGKH